MFGGETWKKEHERKVGEIGNLGSHLKKKHKSDVLNIFSTFLDLSQD